MRKRITTFVTRLVSFRTLIALGFVLSGCNVPTQSELSKYTGLTSEDPILSNNVGSTGTQLLITGGNNQSLSVNSPSASNLEVLAVDSKGLAMSDVEVTFEITQGFGKFTNNTSIATATTGNNGRASLGFSSLAQMGSATIVATSTAGSAVFNFSVGLSTNNSSTGSVLLVANGNNQVVAPSTSAGKNLEVIALDSNGLPMGNLTVMFSILTNGAGSLTGGQPTATVTTGSNGRASVGFTASAQTGSVSVVASSSAGSAVFNLQVNSTANNNSSGSMLLATNGNNQTVVMNNVSGKSLEVMAVNNLGLPIQGVSVKFEVVTSGGGTLTGGGATHTVTTNASGKASTSFTASSQSGAVTVLATSSSGNAIFNLEVTSGATNAAGSSLLIVNGNGQTVIQGQAATKNLEVMAVNSTGLPIAGVTVKYEIITTGSGTLTGGGITTTVTTAANGRASIGFNASSQLGTASIIATSNAGNAVFAVHVTSSTNNTNNNSILLVTNGDNQSVLPGQAATRSLEVLALNNIGTPITGLTVNFEVVTSGAGTLTGGSASASATTNASGKASVNFTASSQLGAVTVVATSTAGSAVFRLQTSPSSNTGASGSILLVTNGNNQTVVKSTSASKNLEVLALDNLGMPISNLTITFQVATSGSGTLSGGATTATATTDANGKASVGFTASSQVGSATVIARSTAGSAAFNLNISNSSTSVYDGSMLLVINGNNQSVTQSVAATKSLEVLAIDNQGAPISGVAVTFEVATSGAGILSGGGTTAIVNTNASGKATIGFTAGNALGSATVIATSIAGSGVFNLTVVPTSTTNSSSSMLLVTNGNNQNVVLNSSAAKDLEVMAIDNKGVPISGLLVSFSVATTGAGTLTGGGATATDTTDANGKANVSFTAGSQTGSVSIVATSTAGSAVFNLQINGAASTIASGSILLVSGGNNQSVVKSTSAASSLEVLALNSAGSPISGLNVKFEIATGGAGTLTGGGTIANVTTNASGKATVAFTAGSTVGSASVVATSTAGSGIFNLQIVNAATANSLGSSLLVLNGNNQTLIENATTGTALQVLALDSSGSPINGLTVQFEVATAGMGTLSGGSTTATGTTDSNGKASVQFTANTQLGSATVIAKSSAGSAVFNLNVISSNSSSATGSVLLAINGNNQSVVKSTAATSSFEVLALNSAGSPISGTTVTFKLATSGAGTLTGGGTTASVTTDAAGRASVGFTASAQIGSASIIATSSAGSTVFNLNVINAATPTTNTLGSALLITAGNNQVLEQNTAAPLSLEVMAVNSSGTPIENITVTFQVSSGAFSGGGTTKVLTTNSNGRASTGFTPGSQLGPISVIATSSAGSNVFNLTVGTQGAGSTLSISGGNGQLLLPNTTASNPLEVIATNSTGAPLTNIPITFTVTTTNGGVLSTNQLQSVTVNTDSNGKSATTFKSSNYVGTVSILASSQIGSVTFSLNTNTITNGSGGSGAVLVFSPTTLVPASGTWLKTEVGNNPSKSITLTNAAATNVYLNSIFTTTQVPFKVTSDDCPRSPTAFIPNASCTINVQFAPQTGGTFNRSLFVNWSALNDGSNGANAVLSLEGSGPEPLIFAGLTSASNTTTTQTQLNWVAASGGTNTQYRIYDVTNNAALIATLPPNTTSYTVTNLIPNSVYKYKAYAVNTAGVEDGNTSIITVTTGVMAGPALTTLTNFVYPATYIRASYDNMNANVNSAVSGDDTGPNGAITYGCKFSRNVTGTGTSKSTCAQGTLGGTFTFNTATGVISWTPKFGTQGVFEFEISGTDSVGTTNQYFTVNVVHPYGSVNQATQNLSTILADYRSSFANRTKQNASSATTWLNTLGNNFTGNVIGNPNFNGSITNSNTDPERFTFDGSTQVNLSSPLAGQSQFMLDYWISNPESTFTNNSTVLKMDSSTSDNGFIVKQNTLENGQRALRFDFERSYGRVINTDSPTAYWRMDETSGTTIDDAAGTIDATIVDGSGNPITTGVTYNISGATLGETTSTALSIHTNTIKLPNSSSLKPGTAFSVEMWVRYPSRNQPSNHDLYTFNTTNTTSGLNISVVAGVLTLKYKPANAATLTLTANTASYGNLFDTNWHHLVFTSRAASKTLYMDGIPLITSTANDGSISWPATPDNAHIISGGDSANPVQVDEVAFYSREIDSDTVKNHLAAGDHFVRNQALYPSNAHMQPRPLGMWRLSDTASQNLSQDFSGNQQDLINTGSTMYRTTAGPYVRPGGSGLDLIGATYPYTSCGVNTWETRLINGDRISFDQKMTFSTWMNFSSVISNGWHAVFFNTNQNSGDMRGITLYAYSDGKLYARFNSNWNANNAGWSQVASSSSVVPSQSGSSLPLGWYHIAMTFDASQPAAQRVQLYVNGVPVRLATPSNTLPSSLSTLSGPSWQFELGTWATNTGCWGNIMQYSMSEAAIYDRALGANEIRAQANEASLRYCDVPITSELTNPYNGRPFDYINMLFDGTRLTIRRNSKTECALRPAVNLGSEGLDLVFGAASGGFKGHITDVRVHGATSGTVATAQDTYIGFFNSMDQHRVNPINGIVNTNLVKIFEPASAMDGVRPYSPGFDVSKIQYTDIGYQINGIRQEPGYLKNFTSTTGWNGNGTPTNPYRLTFDGIDDWVDLGVSPVYDTNPTKFTVCAWVKTNQDANIAIYNRGDGSGWGDFNLGTYSSGLWVYMNTVWTNSTTYYGTYRNNSWHYFCGVASSTQYWNYLDGNIAMGPATRSGNLPNPTSYLMRSTLGRGVSYSYGGLSNGTFFSGDMGGVHIYNETLTQAQIKQNCAAQAPLYNVSTCAP